jgi:hypothetical protein
MFPRMDRPSSSCRNGDIYFVESNRELIFIWVQFTPPCLPLGTLSPIFST